MKLAFFSPLGPQKSGIADYSEELLPYLAEGAEIDLFVEGFKPANRDLGARFRIFDYVGNPDVLSHLDRYDAIVYHIGNDHRYHAGIYRTARKYPGIVVFHDFALQDFFLGLSRVAGDMAIYLDEVEACQGSSARAAAAEAFSRGHLPSQVQTPLAFPLNERLARTAEGIIVHSEGNRQRLLETVPSVPIAHINHHIISRSSEHPSKPSNGQPRVVQIASFGLITPDKGIELALRALASLCEKHQFHYTLVGAPNVFFDVRGLIKRYGLSDRVTVTDHVSLAEFSTRIEDTDIAINLRERTVGETSGSLCRIMAAGVPALVSNVGWFAELPNDAVVKVDMDGCSEALLQAYLERLIVDCDLRSRIGTNARRYVLSEHSIQQSAARYLSFIEEVIAERPRRQLLNAVAYEVSLFGLRPKEDADLLRSFASDVASIAPASLSGASETSLKPLSIGNGNGSAPGPESNGRLPKIDGIDYKRAAIEYPNKLDAERFHYLLTKPFYNLANKPPKHTGDGMDDETHRHFADFINISVALALPAGQRILDAGCGSGWLSEYLARLGYDVTGIDISPQLIQIARERLAGIPYTVDHETLLRCRFITHDIENSPLDEMFDAVVCYDSLHHFVDERAVMRHLARMTRLGGMLFILEGDKPPSGSPTEEELVDVMRRFETLESPFSREYLRALLVEHGFAVVGDYISVNGLFERDQLEGDRLSVTPTEINYLLCKKVVDEGPASAVPDSRRPGIMTAGITPDGPLPATVPSGGAMAFTLMIENTGDTLWLTGSASRRGSVMLAIRFFDEHGNIQHERHGIPKLPHAVAPGESVRLTLEEKAPTVAGHYEVKIDMVAQHVCWFEQHGSEPLVLSFEVL